MFLKRIALFSSYFTTNFTGKREFWAWLNIMFNLVDKERIKSVGADRACAEWLLRNGGQVTFMGEKPTTDYNVMAALPPGIFKKLEEIDATESSITHHGFEHLRGCNFVQKIKFHRNSYVDDRAVTQLELVSGSLVNLEISHCEEVTDTGVNSLAQLSKLSNLRLAHLGVKDWTQCTKNLKKSLPNCAINITPSSPQ